MRAATVETPDEPSPTDRSIAHQVDLPEAAVRLYRDAVAKEGIDQSYVFSSTFSSNPLVPPKAAYSGAVRDEDGEIIGDVPLEICVRVFTACVDAGTPLRLIEVWGHRKGDSFDWGAQYLLESERVELEACCSSAYEILRNELHAAQGTQPGPVKLVWRTKELVCCRMKGMMIDEIIPKKTIPLSSRLSDAMGEISKIYEGQGLLIRGTMTCFADRIADERTLVFE
jgi:hypothetical protein